jgi:hypothetical protein
MNEKITNIEKIPMKGRIKFKVTKPDGTVVEKIVNNTFTDVGNNHVADRLDESPSEAAMGYMAIGTGDTPFTVSSTTLNSELDRNALNAGYPEQRTGSNENEVVYKANWAAGDGTGAITEAGIFNSSIAGTMPACSTFDVVNKGADDSLEITWEVTVGA